MAQPIEPSTQPSEKKSERRRVTLEEAVKMAEQGWKFRMTEANKAEFEANLDAYKRANPLPGDSSTSDAEQPPKASSTDKAE